MPRHARRDDPNTSSTYDHDAIVIARIIGGIARDATHTQDWKNEVTRKLREGMALLLNPKTK